MGTLLLALLLQKPLEIEAAVRKGVEVVKRSWGDLEATCYATLTPRQPRRAWLHDPARR